MLVVGCIDPTPPPAPTSGHFPLHDSHAAQRRVLRGLEIARLVPLRMPHVRTSHGEQALDDYLVAKAGKPRTAGEGAEVCAEPEACYRLGLIREFGLFGTPADEKTAHAWYQKAANAGFEEARNAIDGLALRPK